VDKIFKELIRQSMEVYVDDMVVKSTSCDQHVKDLAKVFELMKAAGMHLNLEKCVIGVERGKFLGFMLTRRGIKANPYKCQAIIEMQNPKKVKDMQRLVGRVVALSRFMAKLNLLKKVSRFNWDEQCAKAFDKLNEFLANPPVIQKPCPDKPILVYLLVLDEAVSSVLV